MSEQSVPPPDRPATMEDVARVSGVSRATISKYFNGATNLRERTVRKIEAACRELAYVPNLYATSLARGHSRLIGVIVPVVTETFFGSLLQALETAALRSGYSLVIQCSHESRSEEARLLQSMLSLNVAGLLITPLANPGNEALLRALAGRTRVVFMDYFLWPDCDYVMTDHCGSMERITRYHLEQGAVPAYLGLPEINMVRAERYRGYAAAMQAYGQPETVVPLPAGVPSWDFAAFAHQHLAAWLADEQARRRLLACGGLVCANDSLAVGAYRALKEAGLRPGRDLPVTGHDDLQIAAYLDPPLTTVRQDLRILGESAVAAVLRCGEAATRPERHRIPGELVLRESA